MIIAGIIGAVAALLVALVLTEQEDEE